jgi:hypothetical protein
MLIDYELFGPSVFIHIKIELSIVKFNLAWNKTDTVYNSERSETEDKSF